MIKAREDKEKKKPERDRHPPIPPVVKEVVKKKNNLSKNLKHSAGFLKVKLIPGGNKLHRPIEPLVGLGGNHYVKRRRSSTRLLTPEKRGRYNSASPRGTQARGCGHVCATSEKEAKNDNKANHGGKVPKNTNALRVQEGGKTKREKTGHSSKIKLWPSESRGDTGQTIRNSVCRPRRPLSERHPKRHEGGHVHWNGGAQRIK